MFVQAMVINITPLIFIPLIEQLGLTYEQVGRLILVSFLTQMLIDLICSGIVDRIRSKPLLVLSHFLAGAGLWIFALSPRFGNNAYNGLILGTIIFSMGCGLLEVLLSQIINSLPSKKKTANMALLHAFYPIGKVAVIVVTGISLQAFGMESWPLLFILWSVVPFLNMIAFLFVEPPAPAHESTRQTVRELIHIPMYLGLLFLMALAGATEVTIAQWTSAFLERGLGFEKAVADIVGFGLFAVGMIFGRLWVGLRGEHLDLTRIMIWSAFLSAVICAVMALSPWPWVSLIACAPAGLFISMLWPGTISLTTARFPLAGASMFALLAASGDGGGSFMSWVVGFAADMFGKTGIPIQIGGWIMEPEPFGLRAGFLLTAACPVVLWLGLLWLRRKENSGL